ncbi:MAG: hypothetical protein O9345_13625 [Burkholderiaceae bacterium]|nr:hypothetical protein [Burkholderiales bacterium]MCZ8339167.1 hypothetical protein [Burkholderiaceae bacterium]
MVRIEAHERILYTHTKIGNSMLSTARSGFDAGRFKGMQVRDRRFRWWIRRRER